MSSSVLRRGFARLNRAKRGGNIADRVSIQKPVIVPTNLHAIHFSTTTMQAANGVSNGNAADKNSTSHTDTLSSILSSISLNTGDLNNTSAARFVEKPVVDPSYSFKSIAISEAEDDPKIREQYRPFLLPEKIANSDWVSKLELATVTKMAEADLEQTGERLKILMLYGSLRTRSYSRLLTYEIARILHRLGADVRIYNPEGLPIKDDTSHTHHKVIELRELSRWSDGHFWVCPEQHGTLTAVFKNQIDWIPLSTGSVRPTQGRTLGLAMVSGGSQSFNTVNGLRVLGRWMRMIACPNQSSVPMAYKLFTPERDPNIKKDLELAKDNLKNGETAGVGSTAGNVAELKAATETGVDDDGIDDEGGSRMMPGGNRDRVVDCAEELIKYTIVMRQHFALFGDRYSERKEEEEKRRKKEGTDKS